MLPSSKIKWTYLQKIFTDCKFGTEVDAAKWIFTGSSEPELNSYWFTSDHLGSSAFITDGSGVAIQHLEYMAFGEVFVDQRRTGFGTPYKFNGKELDCESGYYYYGARYYDPKFGRFLGVDPLADAPLNVGTSPYAYVWNNPLKFIDPTGMHGESVDNDYKLGQDGKLELIRRTKDDYDVLYGTDLDGEVNSNSLVVEKGVVQEWQENYKGQSYTDKNGNPVDYSMIEINDNKRAKAFYEFMASNTIYEFSRVEYGSKGNVIYTSHKSGRDGSGTTIAYDKKYRQGENVRVLTHSHPTDGPPSGPDKSSAEYWNSKGVRTKIFKEISRTYIEFD